MEDMFGSHRTLNSGNKNSFQRTSKMVLSVFLKTVLKNNFKKQEPNRPLDFLLKQNTLIFCFFGKRILYSGNIGSIHCFYMVK